MIVAAVLAIALVVVAFVVRDTFLRLHAPLVAAPSTPDHGLVERVERVESEVSNTGDAVTTLSTRTTNLEAEIAKIEKTIEKINARDALVMKRK